MYRDRAGKLLEELESGASEQAKKIAEVLQRVRPDVVLLNEFDYAAEAPARLTTLTTEWVPRESRLVNALRTQYLDKPQAGLKPITFRHYFYEPVNTGVDSGMDLDGDGKLGGPADAWGYGRYPGQYGMLLLSQLPIGSSSRTYQEMKWRELSRPNWPKHPNPGKHFYPEQTRRDLRLASKSFWDVEVQLNKSGSAWTPLRLLCAHPTPPAFDGPEDRNGRRNYDEIRMIAEYISGARGSRFPVDDNPYLSEGEGYDTLRENAAFVVLGDLNADPADGSGRPGAIQLLLDHPRIDASFVPRSEGGVAAAKKHAELNGKHRGNPAHDTADFGGDGYGNLRVDYVLPSKDLHTVGGGVYWPLPGEPGAEAVRASDHRLVWLDINPAGATVPPGGPAE